MGSTGGAILTVAAEAGTAIFAPELLPVVSAMAAGIGAITTASAQRNAGKAAQNEADYEAQMANIQAGQEQAASQRTMLDKQREKELAQSTLQARAASSGGGALDPSVVNIMGDLESQGTLNEQNALYTGDSKAAALRQSAALKTYSGQVANANGQQASTATLVSGASSMLAKYAPSASPSDDYDPYEHIDDVGEDSYGLFNQ